jgi:hypothetical protein
MFFLVTASQKMKDERVRFVFVPPSFSASQLDNPVEDRLQWS